MKWGEIIIIKAGKGEPLSSNRGNRDEGRGEYKWEMLECLDTTQRASEFTW